MLCIRRLLFVAYLLRDAEEGSQGSCKVRFAVILTKNLANMAQVFPPARFFASLRMTKFTGKWQYFAVFPRKEAKRGADYAFAK